MYKQFCKLNRVLALLLLIALSPLLLLVSILVYMFIDKKVLFIQKRVGLFGSKFNCYKFATMFGNHEFMQPKTSDQEKQRISKLGNLLRKFYLDELPQLINIMKGEMNFIGPRPHEVWHDNHYKERLSDHEYLLKNYKKRNHSKPGLTGLAQCLGLNGAINDEQLAKRTRYDILYLKKKSFFFDFFIILKTLQLIFSKSEK